MGTWLAFTRDGVVPCGTLHFKRLDGRLSRDNLEIAAFDLLSKHRAFYDGAIVYRGRITDYDNLGNTLFTIEASNE